MAVNDAHEPLKVMIVDNEAAIRKGLAACIRWEDIGCAVAAQAADGIEALEVLAATCVDIIISDIRMPGMDGLKLAEAVNRQFPRCKVILLTGYPDFSYAQRAIACGVVDFVLKPTSQEDLMAAIRRASKLILQDQTHRDANALLESQHEQMRTLQRSLFLNELIHNANLSTLYTYNRMAELRLNLREYHVARIMVTAPEADGPLAYRPPIDEVQALMLNQLAAYDAVFIPRSDQTGYIVACTADTGALLLKCREAADMVNSLLQYTLSIGVSRRAADPHRMAQAAQEARQAQQLADYAPGAKVAYSGDIAGSGGEALADIVERLKALRAAAAHAHVQGNLTAAQNLLCEVFDTARKAGAPMETVRNIAAFVYQLWMGALFEHDAEQTIAGNLLSLETILAGGAEEDIQTGLLLFMRQAAERMLDCIAEDTAGAGETVRQIKAYIDEHYAEELSLERLSEIAHLSPSYLSKLFKKETGENISAYLQSVRIESAKALLANTALKSYEVAERVGIPDPVYFSRLFKKLTGLKPKDYKGAQRR